MKMVIAVAGAIVAACLTALSAAAGDSPDESYDAKLRAPATPLVAVDPFFSIWSAADRLTDVETTHWSGKPAPVSIVVGVDGKKYRLLGAEPKEIPAAREVHRQLTPLATWVTYAVEDVRVQLAFLQSAVPFDLDALSRPVTYVSVSALRGEKAVPADVTVSVSGLLTSDDDSAQVEGTTGTFGARTYAKIGRVLQKPLSRTADQVRIDWGFGYVVAPDAAQFSKSGFGEDGRATARDGRVALSWRSMNEKTCAFLLAYDDRVSLKFFDHHAQAWWRRGGKSFAAMIGEAFDAAETEGRKWFFYGDELMNGFRRAGGRKYAELCALAWRQSFAACKVVAGKDGQPLMFSKENGSNGCMGTVDLIYPQAPHLLAYAPTLMKATIAPIMLYASSDRWPYPYAPHDVGTYPRGIEQVYCMGGWYGDGWRMPVEESGNMLIVLGALSHFEGTADFASRWWSTVKEWAEYLEKEGFDPSDQLCTDDFAGHLAHNANLSLKSIMALRCYALMAGQRGEKDVEAKYVKLCEELAAKWQKAAKGGRHGGYRLAFDKPDTWSLKYNLVWDTILGFNLFPQSVRDAETKAYLAEMCAHGVPLDSRKSYTKADWTAWVASMASDRADFDKLIGGLYAFADQTSDRIPFSDWYYADSGKFVGFKARSVIGGLFMEMLKHPELLKGPLKLDTFKVGGYEPLTPELSSVGRALAPYFQGKELSSWGNDRERLHRYVKAVNADANHLPGCVSVLVKKNGAFVVDCLGFEGARPMKPSTMFWISSQTRALAAATLLTVVDEGRLSLDDEVAKYIPGYHPGVTVRQLLSHTSGLKAFPSLPIDERPVWALAQLAAKTPLAYEPGTERRDSNWGVDVAMAVMEKVTGEPFEVTMRKRIFEPLGMNDATFWPTAEQMARMSDCDWLENGRYVVRPIGCLQSPYSNPGRYAEAGAGLFATAIDVARFYRMIAAGGKLPDGTRLLSEAAFAEWMRLPAPADAAAWADPQNGTAKVMMIQVVGDSPAREAMWKTWHRAAEVIESGEGETR